jgi:hypothetical protein
MLWLYLVGGTLLAAASAEVGYRLGKRRHALAPEEKEGPVGAMVAAILGLLGFMLAFTFGVAASRFESRAEMVMQQANAIETAYLRSQLLSEPERTEGMTLLLEYVDVQLPDLTGKDERQVLARAVARSEELQGKLWSLAVSATAKDPVTTDLFSEALKDVFDAHARRVHLGVYGRIPWILWLSLFLLTLLGMLATGYFAGLSAARRSPMELGMLLAFACVIYLVIDLDRPDAGILRTNPRPLVDVRTRITAPASR